MPSPTPATHYDIEADWHLLDTCNFRCGYCFISEARLGAKLLRGPPPERWVEAFDATGLTWLLHMTGGEPTLYPHFAELCEGLARRHLLSFNTNLSRRAVLRLPGRVDPSRVQLINAGLHANERDARAGLPAFLHHAAALREAGFALMVSIVATPEVLAASARVTGMLAPIGMVPVPKLLRGPNRGRRYPQAYTATERACFAEMSARARDAYAPLLARMPERPTVDLFDDDAWTGGTPEFAGLLCRAGRDLVSINATGGVFRCSRRTRLGNILAGNLQRLPAATPCDTSYCVYFCRKYTAGDPAAA